MKTEYTYEAPKPADKASHPVNQKSLAEAAELLNKAEKPFIMVGGGAVISGADKEIFEFAKKLDAPVTCSLMGTGAFPGEDPLYTGMIGMHGSKASNIGITRCDLLVVIGARLSDRVIGRADNFAKRADILHIDIDPAEINKNIASDHFVVGDIKEVLTALNQKFEQKDHKEWIQEVEDLKVKYPLKVGEGLTGQFVVEKLYEITKGMPSSAPKLVSTRCGRNTTNSRRRGAHHLRRSGLHGLWHGRFHRHKIANPDRTVINIAGDGCFR